ncbi:hypothetical protein [Streptomyces sparsogenes]|uniref:Transmembrane transport protein n=1 Tax=Streptomyces sparsogenes DSM 40356 TaxID=1331668 RepID=A0A1R1SGZ9_9ACTN|nr:hypothetical protein [Streptomyces sparsogenes]OMI37644.1 transmembrane transport protein [Streptomyces sparsogenes DSM 40356]
MNTVPARPAAPREHPSVRGLLWPVGRQPRAALCAGLVLIAAVAAYILWMRADMVGYLRAHGIEDCAQWRACCGPHSEAYAHVHRAYRDPLLNTGRLILALPALAGVFPLERCLSADGGSGTENCLARLGATRRAYEEPHPAGHSWPLQWIQAGICLSAAAALAAFCVWWVRRRPTVKETA